jgi:hypothetical protein
MLVLFISFFVIILSVEKIETIRLEYKYSNEEYLTYSEIQIIERHDFEKHLGETIEYIEINLIKNIEKRINSLRLIPHEQYKYNQLSETTYQQIDDQFLSHPAELSSFGGHIVLSSPNQPKFPQDDIQIGNSWIIPITNSLGEIHYKLIHIDENEIAQIDFEGGLSISSDASLIGKWTFDIKRGITLTLKTSSTSSILSDYGITKIITKKLIT